MLNSPISLFLMQISLRNKFKCDAVQTINAKDDTTYNQQNYYYLMIKVKYGKQIHLIKVHNGFAGLQTSVKKVFKELPYRYHFMYWDDDNDEIIVDCQDDLKVLLEEIKPIGSKQKAKIVKLQVKQEIQLLSAMGDSQCGSEFISLDNQDHQSSVQLLQEDDIITAEEKQCGMEYAQDDLLDSIQYSESSEINSADISQMVRQHMLKMEDKLIEQVIALEQDENQMKQVNNYLDKLYKTVEKQKYQEYQEQYKEAKKQNLGEGVDFDEEIGEMIQISLKKLLPDFIKRLSTQTIKSVKELVQQQSISQAHHLSKNSTGHNRR